MTSEQLKEYAEKLKLDPSKVELDYQMSRVLFKLSERWHDCVFKGGTSLFKCYNLSDRFSEDLDISFTRDLSREERKALKESIVEIAAGLDMKITNFFNTKIKRDYNCYLLEYKSVLEENLTGIVKLEISLGNPSFPTEVKPVNTLIPTAEPFSMQVQSLERTFVDKTFALCDYYLTGKNTRLSRHIFDLYKINPLIKKDDKLKALISEVRAYRQKMWVCPSAKEEINISEILTKIVKEDYYRADYLSFATQYENPPMKYDTIITVLVEISESGLFDR